MKKVAFLLIVLMLPFASIQAQGIEGNDLTLPDGRVITLPSGWTFEAQEELYLFTSSDYGNMIVVIPPDLLADVMGIDAKTNPSTLLTDIYTLMYEEELDEETVERPRTADDRRIVLMDGVSEYAEQSHSLVIEVEEGSFAYAELHVIDSTTPDEDLQLMLEIIVSLRPLGTVAVGLAEEEPAVATGEPCEVQAEGSNVSLRVGPGENRGVFTGMPADTYLPVLGQTEADDGSQWWRVDMQSGANELWVADTDVTTRGDCALVADVNAPPVIPGAPTTNTNTNSGTTGNTNPQPPVSNPPAAGTVRCPIQNLSVFTLKGDLYGPNGEHYYFEVGAGSTITLNIPAGTYSVHYYCDGCGDAGGDNVWPVNGRTIFQIQVTDQPY
jgi:hypothetical protein